MSARAGARGVLGVGIPRRSTALGEAVHAGPGVGAVVAAAGLGAAVLAQVAVPVLAPQIALSLGVSTDRLANALDLWPIALVLAAPFALRAGLGRASRPLTAGAGGLLLALGFALCAVATRSAWVGAGAACGGAGTVLVAATGRPLLLSAWPAAARLRVGLLATAGAMLLLGAVPLLVLLLPDGTALTWRLALLVVAALTAAAAVAAAALPDVDEGTHERRVVAAVVAGGTGAREEAPRLRFVEAVRRAYAVGVVRPALGFSAALGLLVLVLAVDGATLLTERDGLTASVAGLALAGVAVVAAGTVVACAGHLERAWRDAPHRLGGLAALATGVAAASVALLAAPVPALTVLALAAATAALAVAAAAVAHLVLTLAGPELRGTVGVLAAVHAAAGYLVGGTVAAGIDASHGLASLVIAAALVLAGVALLLRTAASAADSDLDRVVDDLVEREELTVARAAGRHAPLLTCRRICFSYGQLQVLFDVDLTVEEGEMVALLGTNGAGKSTLLKAVSGVGLPSSGTVRLRGRDITYADPGERVRLGVTQIPGGKAVFGPLSVAENLRLYGYALGRDRKSIDRGIEEGLATFPRLAERRNAPASTLSGGEQQMLALTKALILKPSLLLIDELSLGLSPRVVGELLELVRRINATGTAVVLVEQSVNVALSLAHHAYFMEKGAVRFDGPTADLLERPDILRSVFLQGAAAGLAS